ncbi:hypothetical protein SAMN05444162_4339 [Paenibacillaceae bacterium GAS479]|nr:hypothetical protein SAMN05444162_4339 [Paenibacillaceae bacterium GAS479]
MSSKSRFNPSVILILFILLIVAVGVTSHEQRVSSIHPPGNGSGILSTQGFLLRNDTVTFTLVITDISGEPVGLPSPIFMYPGAINSFELPSRIFETTQVHAEYTVFSEMGEILGLLTFTMKNPIVFPTFSNIRTTAPINTRTTTTEYPEVNPLLIVTNK